MPTTYTFDTELHDLIFAAVQRARAGAKINDLVESDLDAAGEILMKVQSGEIVSRKEMS